MAESEVGNLFGETSLDDLTLFRFQVFLVFVFGLLCCGLVGVFVLCRRWKLRGGFVLGEKQSRGDGWVSIFLYISRRER